MEKSVARNFEIIKGFAMLGIYGFKGNRGADKEVPTMPLGAGAHERGAGIRQSSCSNRVRGEGPGKAEDAQGEPFVGAAGKFLNTMLESIKMTREDVFITNVVKCRPPNNRDPQEDEIKTCTSLYLWAQLELIKPLLVATLGRHSMYEFLPATAKISGVHGKPVQAVNKRTGRRFNVLPLYHPAAAL